MQSPTPAAASAAPPETAGSPGRKTTTITTILLTALFLAALVAVFQWASDSRHSELGAHPDEAAHFVTGLMVRDYIASGLHGSPLHYADEYYRHYPKIGLGIWPPFFYLVQAAWTLPLGAGVGTVLTLMGLLVWLLALLLAARLGCAYGPGWAAAGAVLLLALPLVQQYSNMVMAEILSALLMFGAAVSFADFLDGESRGAAMGFGVCAGLAIMTKGTGVALVFLPAFAILFTGRFAVLKNPRLWAAAALVLVIAGPWTWHFRNQGRGGWEEPSPSWHFTKSAIVFYGRQMLTACGWMLSAAALVGAGALFFNQRRPALPASCLGLVLSVWIFQCLMPVGLEARHLTPAMPALMVLAVAGCRWAEERFFGGRFGRPGMLALLVLALFFLAPFVPFLAPGTGGYGSLGNQISFSPFHIQKKEFHGFETIHPTAPLVLVASDARGEGMFIAEMAMRDPHRPSFTVERGSKLLAASTWSGSGYQDFYTTPAQVIAALQKAGITQVVTDSSPEKLPPHNGLLEKTLADGAGGFHREQAATAVRDGRSDPDAVQLFTETLP